MYWNKCWKLNEVYDELEQKKTPSAEHRRKLLNEAADLQEPLAINAAGMMNGLYYNEKKKRLSGSQVNRTQEKRIWSKLSMPDPGPLASLAPIARQAVCIY
jgi:hypothetical protein